MALPTDKHFTARVIERKDLSEDLWLIRVDPGGPFSFKAGQYATLGVDHEDKRIERAYSIVSSPLRRKPRVFHRARPAGRAHAASLQTSSRRHVALPQNLQGAVHSRSKKWPNQSPSSRHGYGNRARS